MRIEIETTLNQRDVTALIVEAITAERMTITQSRHRQISSDMVFRYTVIIDTHWTETRGILRALHRRLAKDGTPYLMFYGEDTFIGLYDLLGNYNRSVVKYSKVSPVIWGKQTMMHRNFKAMKLLGAI